VKTAAKPTDTIDPRALAAFREHMGGLDLSKYDLKFYETPSTYVIFTRDKLKPPGAKRGKLPEYSVAVSREDFHVIKVWFGR
jgi:hypothetical protein